MCFGIATGYTTNIPAHNLKEVIDGVIYQIKNPELTIDDLMKYIKAPDFPNGGMVCNKNVKLLYETGKAPIISKAKYQLETTKSGNTKIVFYELPDGVNKPKLVEEIYNICLTAKEIQNVLKVKDESDKQGVRVTVELNKTAIPEIIIKDLYNKTKLKNSETYIMRAVVNNKPELLSLKQIIQFFIEHRRECVNRRTKFWIKKNEARKHILEAYIILVNNIDEIINIMRNNSLSDAEKVLKEKFKFSKEQLEKIMDVRLRQFSKDDIFKFQKEINEIDKENEDYSNVLNNIDEEIIKELKEIKNKCGDDRRTEIIDEEEATVSEVVKEDVVVVVTNKNSVKYYNKTLFDDFINKNTFKERTEIFTQIYNVNTADQFIVVLNSGKCLKLGFSELITLNVKEKIIGIVSDIDKEKFIVAVSKKGLIKKTQIECFKSKSKDLLQLEDDELIDIKVVGTDKNNIITLVSKDGLIHRFFEQSFKETNVGGKGTGCMNLQSGNEIVAFEISKHINNAKLVVFCKFNDETYGYKSMDIAEFKPKGRMSQGIKGFEFGKKNGNIIGFSVVEDVLKILDVKGNLIELKDLPIHSRILKPQNCDVQVLIIKNK